MAAEHVMGVRDVPIAEYDEDRNGLGIEAYARALTEFALQTETPMTIGIQGDWGSGKTSLMNLIEASLLEAVPDNDRLRTITVNTWAYSQAVEEVDLPAAIVGGILSRFQSEKKMEVAKKVVGVMGRFGARVVSATTGIELEDAVTSMTERSTSLESLKTELTRLVASEVDVANGGRVVAFVDDLDRILPVRAVEILEALKVFLDVPGCVFVLACDYEVVKKGLDKKFGVGGDELAGRSFFDKIIQVPFQMPVHSEPNQVRYLDGLLRRIGAQISGEEAVRAALVVLRATRQTNPRTVKRLVNILNLLRIILNSDEHRWDDGYRDRDLVVFALVALQNWSPHLHAALCRSADPMALEPSEVPALKRAMRNLEKSDQAAQLEEARDQLGDVMGVIQMAIQRDLPGGESFERAFRRFVSVSDVASVRAATEAPEPETSAGQYFLGELEDELQQLAKRIMSHAVEVAKKQERDHKKYNTMAIKLSGEDTWYLVRDDDGKKLWFAQPDYPDYASGLRAVMASHSYENTNVMKTVRMRGGRQGLCFALDIHQAEAAEAVCATLLTSRWWGDD